MMQHWGQMSTRDENERLEPLQGTLDLLILRTLIFGQQHGQGIALAILQSSDHELLVEHGALYPALQRLEDRGSYRRHGVCPRTTARPAFTR